MKHSRAPDTATGPLSEASQQSKARKRLALQGGPTWGSTPCVRMDATVSSCPLRQCTCMPADSRELTRTVLHAADCCLSWARQEQ